MRTHLLRKGDRAGKGRIAFRSPLRALAARFDHKRRARAAKRLGHTRCRANNSRRRRIGGHQHQNVFAASRMRHRSRRGARETVGSATQGNFAQRRQIRSREKVRKRRPDPLGRVDFARTQALDEVSRLQIDDFDRIGRVENAVGDPLGGRHSRHGGNLVVKPLEMLHIHRRVHIDARTEQLFDILIALAMAAPRRIGMRQLVYQHNLGTALQGGVEVELAQSDVSVLHRFHGQHFQAIEQGKGVGARVRLNVAHYHIDALILDTMRLGEHGEGLSHAGGVPEEHLEPAAPLEALRLTRFLFLPDSLQDGIGVAAAAADLPSLSNFRHVTCPFASSQQRPCILARPIPQPHLIRYPFPSGFLQARQAPLTPARRRA